MAVVSKAKKRGRPSKYNQELGKKICEELSEGKSLNSICSSPDLPSEAAVRGWALDPGHPFSSDYARAREIGHWKLSEEIVEIADQSVSGDVNAARLRVDARKWILSKQLPKTFGDKITTEHQGEIKTGETPPTRDVARVVLGILNNAAIEKAETE